MRIPKIGVLIILLMSTGTILAQGGGTSLLFDGSDDWLNCGPDSLGISDSVTIEAWIKASESQPQSYGRILDKFNWYNKKGFNFVLEYPVSGGSVMLDFFTTDGSEISLVGNTRINDDQWHHVATTFDGSSISIYIDGNMDMHTVFDSVKISPSSNFLGIGNNSDGAAWFPFHGQIDEARLWKAVLDSATLRAWMFRKITPDHPYSSGLIGYWQFDEGAGDTTADLSGKMHQGTLINTDTTNAWVPSTVPLATDMTESLQDLSAVWISRKSANSSIMNLTDTTITGDQWVIFGHDNGGLEWDSLDIPGDGGVSSRLSRRWRLEVYNSPAVDIGIDVSNLRFKPGAMPVLLVDPDGLFTDADTVGGIMDTLNETFTVRDYSPEHGNFYSLGIKINTASVIPESRAGFPGTFTLSQNYPNPFNPVTKIRFILPVSTDVELNIYNTRGMEIRSLIHGPASAGEHFVEWDGTDSKGQPVSSGIYIYRLRAGNSGSSRKMILLR